MLGIHRTSTQALTHAHTCTHMHAHMGTAKPFYRKMVWRCCLRAMTCVTPTPMQTCPMSGSLPLQDFLEKHFGEVSYQNVKDIKVNKGLLLKAVCLKRGSERVGRNRPHFLYLAASLFWSELPKLGVLLYRGGKGVEEGWPSFPVLPVLFQSHTNNAATC